MYENERHTENSSDSHDDLIRISYRSNKCHGMEGIWNLMVYDTMISIPAAECIAKFSAMLWKRVVNHDGKRD